MVYQVIGLMSGSSRDGLDIVYVHIEEIRGQWSYQLKETACKPYPAYWHQALQLNPMMPFAEFLELHTRYGRFLGESVLEFIKERGLEHQVHFIASHGHTAHHHPQASTSFQIGDGAQMAAMTGLPVISDLRSMDVALGGQGAPIVPIGDRLLFPDFQYWLNIGGIANLTIRTEDGFLAGDISAANQAFNRLATQIGKSMDEDGAMGARGTVKEPLLQRLGEYEYYRKPMPKSLSNEDAMAMMGPLWDTGMEVEDLMATVQAHLVFQMAQAITSLPGQPKSGTMLATGGGALNASLMNRIQRALAPLSIELVVPDKDLIEFKEALVMALMGVLRWREETNIYAETTGAKRNHIAGALWMGSGYQLGE